MKIHEYQGKAILAKYGVAVPRGRMVETREQELDAKDPNAIVRVPLLPGFGLRPFQARQIAFRLGLDSKYTTGAMKFMMALARAAEATDASLVEINPFITTTDGRLFALDAKMNFDDNALYRHPDILEL